MANEKEVLQIKKKPQEVSDDELQAISGGMEPGIIKCTSARDTLPVGESGTASCSPCK